MWPVRLLTMLVFRICYFLKLCSTAPDGEAVYVSGAKGHPPTGEFKVSICNFFLSVISNIFIVFCWTIIELTSSKIWLLQVDDPQSVCKSRICRLTTLMSFSII